jgi:hypothetical protein
MSGYGRARKLREIIGGLAEDPLNSVSDAAAGLNIAPLVFEPHNHLQSAKVHAAVGWRGGLVPVVAGPKPARESNVRFLEARALYHAAFACGRGPRLVTNATTWNQRASRAFAAELLAPQSGIHAHFDAEEWARDPDSLLQRLAHHYNVSAMVVQHQLVNAGLVDA